MSNFRVLVLVLASDTDPVYCAFESAWKLASHPRVDLFFVKAHPDTREDFLFGDTIRIGCRECLEHIYEKQMRAFRLLRPRLSQYAYVFRTNLSSFVHLPRYLEFCKVLPRTGVYSGVVGDHGGTPFASGSGFTITPDLIERLLDENPPWLVDDDVSIGKAITSWGVPILPAPRIDHIYDNGAVLIHQSPISLLAFHHRVKTSDRWKDVALVQSLFQERLRPNVFSISRE